MAYNAGVDQDGLSEYIPKVMLVKEIDCLQDTNASLQAPLQYSTGAVTVQYLPISKGHSPKITQVMFFSILTAAFANASTMAWGDFANNIGSDLAPLLALFGEQVTKQYLSESFTWIDNLIFALAPLGIITAIVAAIRVGGNSKLRSLIGRATESRGSVEADLMSSTSPDVCELWNGEGVVRVLGSPVLLQLVHVKSEESEKSAGIFTFQEAVREGHYEKVGGEDQDTESLLGHQNPPNLSINVSIKPIGKHLLIAITLLGFGLQAGVLIFAAFAQYKPITLKGNEPSAYGFPVLAIGTLCLAVGMFLCARVIELSTEEAIYKPTKTTKRESSVGNPETSEIETPEPQSLKSTASATEDCKTVIWLQQGGQTVGDQLFESFARQSRNATIITSWKSKTERNAIVILAVSTTLFGFIAQFVGLRAMHPSIIVAQLGIILIMTVFRSILHIRRDKVNEIKNPDRVDGHELDWLAKDLNNCESWEIATDFHTLDEQEGDNNPSSNKSPNAMTVMRARTRLATLSKHWTLENRSRVKILHSAIEGTMKKVFAEMTIKDGWKDKDLFRWTLPVRSKFKGERFPCISPLCLNMKRTRDDDNNWKAWEIDENELEAVLYLWTSSVVEAVGKGEGQPRLEHVRLLGPSTFMSRDDYKLWINRGTAYSELSLPASNEDRYYFFGWTGTTEGLNDQAITTPIKLLGVTSDEDLWTLCAQGVYAQFMFSLAILVEKVGGSTTRRTTITEQSATSNQRRGDLDDLCLINSNLASLAACFSESGLGMIKEAYFCIVPAFRAAKNIPFSYEAHRETIKESEKLGEQGLWEQAIEIDLWIYKNYKDSDVGYSWLDIRLMHIDIQSHIRQLAIKLVLEDTDETFKANIARIWDSVYVGCEAIPEAPIDRAINLMHLYLTRQKVNQKMDETQLFEVVVDAVRRLDIGVPGMGKKIMSLAELAHKKGFLDIAEAVARFLWTEMVKYLELEDREAITETRITQVGTLLVRIRQQKGTFFLDDQRKFSVYLNQSHEPNMSFATSTRIHDRVRAKEIDEDKIPIDLLLIRGHRTPLQWAAENGHEQIVKEMLKTIKAVAILGGVIKDPHKQFHAVNEVAGQDSGRTALQAAAGSGHEKIVRLLIAAGAEVNAEPGKNSGRTALQAAAGNGHENIVKLLLAHGADIYAAPSNKSHGGRTTLQAAAEGGHKAIVKLLLIAGAQTNTGLGESYPRITLEAPEGDIDRRATVKLFIDPGAQVNAGPGWNFGRTALQAAAGSGYEEIVTLLLEAAAEINARPGWNSGRTALQAAAGGGHLKTVKLLIIAGADINAKPGVLHGRTALQAAAEGGHVDVINLLLNAGAEINAEPGKHSGRTALQAAAGGGHEEVVKLLLTHRAHINAEPGEVYGRTALQAAADGGHKEIVKYLLDAGADINAPPYSQMYDEKTIRTLQIPVGDAHKELSELFPEPNAEVNTKSRKWFGRTALQAAAGGGHGETIKLLLSSKADVDAAPGETYGRTALQAAAEDGHACIVKLLLFFKADVNAAPGRKFGRTALQAAAGGGHKQIVNLLLDFGADANAAPGELSGRTALQAAAGGGHKEIVQLLIDAKAEVNAEPGDFDGLTALQAAAKGGHEAIVRLLLDNGADIDTAPGKHGGSTALQAAIAGGSKKIVKQKPLNQSGNLKDKSLVGFLLQTPVIKG